MAEFYDYRNEILFRGVKREDGVTPYVKSGWYDVSINGRGSMLQPEDLVTSRSSYSTDKPVTGYVIVEKEALGAGNSRTGGNVTLPRP